MTTSDPTPPHGTPPNSPNGPTASDRGESDRRRRSRRTRSPSELQGDSPSDDADVSSPSNALARASALLDAVVARVRSQPHASMAIAAGVGFVLGGALSFRAGRVVLAAATRHVGRELFKQVV